MAQVTPAPHVVHVTLCINGAEHHVAIEPRVTLLDILWVCDGLTGTKKGREQGKCGGWTLHVNGHRVLLCPTLAWRCAAGDLTTIDGLARPDRALRPVQAAFIKHDAFQCGYCPPGQVMSAVGCMQEGDSAPQPARTQPAIELEEILN